MMRGMTERFRKSSYCGAGHCVEVAFHRSSFCGGGACVEVATDHDGHVVVRDSKNPGGPVLVFTGDEWDGFLAGAKAGEFDLL